MSLFFLTSSCLSFCCSLFYRRFHKLVFVFFFLIYILANLSDLLSNSDFVLPVSFCFFSILRRPFNISFQIGLVLLFSFHFYLSEKFFISPPLLNDNLAGQSILGCRFSHFKTLNIFCHSLLACSISLEKSADSLMGGFPFN